ncbi:TetR/AcrR family transcriptional regulator [Myceligenerans indicum]|uniref:TetR family transcriptional regulator n=1 Tax=Myceligenerans indicum TaxID=2593663 RepID=A0ABS1LKQ2_9MICO|nr:TetR/AcrR family transcriptional regulator [Myceligenerans indicum]MBL0886825.1 TetR family transcriptional regulator [Myceligenerans indicum]
MARWRPGSTGRLQQAAIELFTENGYDATTVAEIAERAGVTERTFFRHYGDKREVLFAGQQEFQSGFVDAITDAPPGTPAMELSARALDAASRALQEARGREHARARYAIISAHAPLREREQLKLAVLAQAVTDALVIRGIPDLPAHLAGDVVVSVFSTAFARWIAPGETRDLLDLQHEALAELANLAGTITAA